jgi:hypothetical protein
MYWYNTDNKTPVYIIYKRLTIVIVLSGYLNLMVVS